MDLSVAQVDIYYHRRQHHLHDQNHYSQDHLSLEPSSQYIPQRHVRSERLLGRSDVADVWSTLR